MSDPTWSPQSWAQDETLNFDPLNLFDGEILDLSPPNESNPNYPNNQRLTSHTMDADSGAHLPSHATMTAPIACAHPSCNCGTMFKRRSDLKKHVERRTRPYRCLERGCQVMPFTNKHDLVRHHREVHSGDGAVTIPCPIPGCKRNRRGFNRKDNLAAHMRNMHSRAEAAEHALPDKSSNYAASNSGQTSVTGSSPVMPQTPVQEQQFLLPDQVPQDLLFGDDFAFAGVCNGPDQLLLSLQEELGTLAGRKNILLAQLQSVQSQYDAVQHTIRVLQMPTTTFDN